MTDFTAPTQSEHPWKATIRTVFQMAVGLAAILPLVIDDLTGAGPWAAAVVGIAVLWAALLLWTADREEML